MAARRYLQMSVKPDTVPVPLLLLFLPIIPAIPVVLSLLSVFRMFHPSVCARYSRHEHRICPVLYCRVEIRGMGCVPLSAGQRYLQQPLLFGSRLPPHHFCSLRELAGYGPSLKCSHGFHIGKAAVLRPVSGRGSVISGQNSS